jgi:hypothetical protein
MEKPLLPKKLRLELANKTSDLLIQIMDEPFSEKLTKAEEDFTDLVIALSQISSAYSHLANSYMRMYTQYIKQNKK